ncbi:hypothetical protein ACJRO7_035600 [Eucalyptus globulus]|uniref:Uncharacterized protein n=1 Tax=Eucalyptus globulus TaxID=34317 RepID=A0ABD3J6N2_EUCGL
MGEALPGQQAKAEAKSRWTTESASETSVIVEGLKPQIPNKLQANVLRFPGTKKAALARKKKEAKTGDSRICSARAGLRAKPGASATAVEARDGLPELRDWV